MNQKEFTPAKGQILEHSKNFNVLKMFDKIKDWLEHTHKDQNIVRWKNKISKRTTFLNFKSIILKLLMKKIDHFNIL